MKKLFKDRKTLYLVLALVMLSIFTLTVAYAALNTVLKITGNAEVSSADWDIRLENVKLISGSVGNSHVITHKDTVEFSFELSNPGDYYMFTVDVVNSGSIDAMIESIEKLPELTSEQTKFMNYIIEYENGNTISTKQLVQANSFVRLKVKIEFRKDISNTDLPSTTEELNLSFIVKYTQADESGSSVTDNGVEKKLINVVKGDGTNTSDEICIGEECFYVISSTEEEIKMLAKYNLLVGNKYDDTNKAVPLANPTGIQDETAIGWFSEYSVDNPMIGVKHFSSTNYWSSTTSTYPAYVYNENSYLYEYVENYKSYLVGLGASINEARLITIEELEGLGCSRSSVSCSGAPSWVYSTTYWSGVAYSSAYIYNVSSNSSFGNDNYTFNDRRGVRPVIVIDRSLI